jgi:hypothetical protein
MFSKYGMIDTLRFALRLPVTMFRTAAYAHALPQARYKLRNICISSTNPPCSPTLAQPLTMPRLGTRVIEALANGHTPSQVGVQGHGQIESEHEKNVAGLPNEVH